MIKIVVGMYNDVFDIYFIFSLVLVLFAVSEIVFFVRGNIKRI